MYTEKIVVLIPCYNEEKTIKKVIEDFSNELPQAQIYMYDNNSTDRTVEVVKSLNKNVIIANEYNQGKGNVVRRMFNEIDADVYILVDGDDTYPAEAINQLLLPIIEKRADMTVGDRLSNESYKNTNKRMFHEFGNNIVKKLINLIFNSNINDVMSGYRVFNKSFVKSIQIQSNGFEIETEMTIFALENQLRIEEIPIEYRDRPKGSHSKLHTIKDGIKIIKKILSYKYNWKMKK